MNRFWINSEKKRIARGSAASGAVIYNLKGKKVGSWVTQQELAGFRRVRKHQAEEAFEELPKGWE